MARVAKVLTLAAGNNQLSALLIAAGVTSLLAFRELEIDVAAGGPVAIGDNSMAALTDGRALAATDPPFREQAGAHENIDATQIYIRPTVAGDKISVVARSR